MNAEISTLFLCLPIAMNYVWKLKTRKNINFAFRVDFLRSCQLFVLFKRKGLSIALFIDRIVL